MAAPPFRFEPDVGVSLLARSELGFCFGNDANMRRVIDESFSKFPPATTAASTDGAEVLPDPPRSLMDVHDFVCSGGYHQMSAYGNDEEDHLDGAALSARRRTRDRGEERGDANSVENARSTFDASREAR